jgi:raffinose/stachyose/melibiose transport system permease protein
MRWFSKAWIILLFLFPTLLIYTGYMIFPVAVAFYYSLTNFSGIGAAEFTGIRNYLLLFNDPFFAFAIKNTFIVLITTLVILLPSSFLLAHMLNRRLRVGQLMKALNFSPNVIAPIIVGLIWLLILDPYIGFINIFLKRIGLGLLAGEWIGGRTLTPFSVSIVFTWRILGFVATIFLAGMKMIPLEILDSSSIDGANSRQRMFYITIPMMKETFIITVVLIITGSFRLFEEVYMLTGGGPIHRSEVLVSYMYYTTFISSEYGRGMGIAVICFVLSLLFSIVYIRLTYRRPD